MTHEHHPPGPRPAGGRRSAGARAAIPLLLALGAACADDAVAPAAADDEADDLLAASALHLRGSRAYDDAIRAQARPGMRLAVEAAAADRVGFSKAGTFFRTDVATAGVGAIRDIGTATIALAGVSGTVSRAFLYWHAVTNTDDTNVLASPQLNGMPLSGINIGLSSDNCWGYQNSQAWYADVTDIVRNAGNGDYALTGFGSGSPANGNGASLVVFYQDGNTANDGDVVLYHGNDSNQSNPYDDPGWNVTLNDITYTGGAASMELHVSDGQTYPDGPVLVNGTQLLAAGNNFQGTTVPGVNNGPTGDGRLWDIRDFDVVPFLTPGSNDLELTSSYVNDCLSLVVALVKLPAGAAPAPPFVFAPSQISLSLSRSANVYVFGSATFDASAIDPAEVRLYAGDDPTGAPVAMRGAAYLTATGDFNADGHEDRLLTFRMSDLVAAGLTTSSTTFVLADRTGAELFEGVLDVAPVIHP